MFNKQVRTGLIALSQQILGPNTLIQGALPEILTNTPQSFFDNTMRAVQVRRNVVALLSSLGDQDSKLRSKITLGFIIFKRLILKQVPGVTWDYYGFSITTPR